MKAGHGQVFEDDVIALNPSDGQICTIGEKILFEDKILQGKFQLERTHFPIPSIWFTKTTDAMIIPQQRFDERIQVR
jgi:hypothetical protein